MRKKNTQLDLFLDNWLVEIDMSKHGLGIWQYGTNFANRTLGSLLEAQQFIGMNSDVQLRNRSRVEAKEEGYGFDLIAYKIDIDGVQEWRNIGYRSPFSTEIHFGFPDAVLDNGKIRLYAPNDDRCLYVLDINE